MFKPPPTPAIFQELAPQPTPESHRALLQQILAEGQLLLLQQPACLPVIERAWHLLAQAFPQAELTELHRQLDADTLWEAITELRRQFQQDSALRQAYAELLTALGFDLQACAVDVPRLRAVIPGAEHNPAAQPAYFAHRDTWYANPAAQLNLWLPLADYPPQQTFVFWPELFKTPVENDSEAFDYHSWKQRVGFQAAQHQNALYPRALQAPEQPATGFACQAGQVLLFAAAHLHQTLPNPGPQIRYSLDLRLVDLLWQQQGQAAPDPDNGAQGSTLREYTYLGAWA